MDFDGLYPILSKLRASEQVVLTHLFHHKTNNEVYASQQKLVSWTGIKSINTIKSALKGLNQQGFVKCLKAGEKSAPALYRLSLPITNTTMPDILPSQNDVNLNRENHLRLAAIKKGFAPATWQEIKREAKALGTTEDAFIIQKYFGPERLIG